MVTITSVGEGKCVWCCQKTAGVHATFTDGLAGFFCRKHLWQALQVRAKAPSDDSQTENSRLAPQAKRT